MRRLDGITDSRLNGYEFEEIQGDSDGQGSQAACSLPCCRTWGHKEWDMTQRLKNSNNIYIYKLNHFAVHQKLT